MDFEKFYERDDIKTTNKIEILITKIFKFLNKNCNQKKLYSEKHKKFIIQCHLIDKKYNDLYLFIDLESNNAGTYYNAKIDNEVIHAITLNILKNTGDNIPNLCQIKNFDQQTLLKIKITLAHELTHYFDAKKFDINKTLNYKATDLNTEEEFKKYFNSVAETNAYFTQTAYHIFQMFKKIKSSERWKYLSFDSFRGLFWRTFNNKFKDLITDKNKKKLEKRVYSFYNELEEYFIK
jgi:hypothetical protein